ncbi:MAG: acetyltransferase [Schaedlerella sp.]|nr:acetyltransferase [Alloprevotella sp.]MDY4201823.1 acetyltransferase [Schaedlerella sp.]
MNDIAIFGAGGFGREVACLIKRINEKEPIWNFIGFFDDNEALKGTRNEYGEVLGGMNELNAWNKELCIAIGIGSPKAVYAVVSSIHNARIVFPNLIDPTVVIADKDNYQLGKGNIFAANCIISIAVKVGDFNTFNNNTVLGHDDVIGSFNSFMPNVNISGGVIIGDKNFLGVKSTVLQYLKMGNNVTVGGNSLIIRNTKDGYLYMGIPAKKIEL